MDKEREALAEIAKLTDKHKAEGNERGELCRRITAILDRYGLRQDASRNRLMGKNNEKHKRNKG
ncbi:MAG: hypothetical protein J5966_08905 [Lachnospiraceae bacterium]|nr:hypothetical protein [Lachnospiraceae bacterium]